MRKSDEALVRDKQRDYQRALAAAYLSARADRRLLGMIKCRDRIIEVAALNALGSDASFGKKFWEGFDGAGSEVVHEAYTAALKAAKEALV